MRKTLRVRHYERVKGVCVCVCVCVERETERHQESINVWVDVRKRGTDLE